ncbi:hypothetical protein PC116_g16044 [Phytophthora cactorum]|nr:hypothetical protein PC111_g11039 [Phytophthora cactorum]KAG2912264.1 hypothetical protein PC115_g12371 [Phytophthora cactorum]KAG3070377.1 hypothetical protein PC121_g9522 [Phytophthora cactorum]KAG3159987.1 hypothetical protein C6341_g13934 [Phytophthora cactorum]KAG4235849.1 hypothetical protein PC116_g16044 [Phytophthora cactorum]
MPFNDMRATSRNCQDQRRKMSSSEASKNANASSAPSGGPTDGQDLTVFVQSLLEQMQSRFAQMSDAIIGRNILFTNSFLHVAVHC